MKPNPELTVVIPAYNEAECIVSFLDDLAQQLDDCCPSFEIVVIDDGSLDETWPKLHEMHARLPGLRAFRFTRNFGKEAAILAGLRKALGDAVVVMDADGQHPISLLPEMIALWREGKAQIIAGQKIQRSAERLFSKTGAWFFNRMMKIVTGLDLQGASDFRLLDRVVVNSLLAFPEKIRFFRGMTVWTGYKTVNLGFNVAPRIAGDSHWNSSQLTRLAITAITAYSAKPLVMVFRLGLLGTLLSGLLLIQAMYSWASGIAVSGWTSLTIVVIFFGSATLLGIGILGAYLAQIFDEIKARPEYLIANSLDVSEVNNIDR